MIVASSSKNDFVSAFSENDFVPRRGDHVTFNLCPMPPKFEKFQVRRS
jgi:hypothetical protein